MPELRSMACCGLKEIHGVSAFPNRPHDLLKTLLAAYGLQGFASGMIFTGAASRKTTPEATAESLKAYIEEHNLGEVHVFPPHRNKNTGRYIYTYLWQVKPRNLGKWHRET